jgi:hypothetical protein
MPSPLPPGAGAASGGLRPRPRPERPILVVILVAAVALIAVTIASLGSSSSPSRRGCIHAVVPGPIGSTFFDQCGAPARATCASLQVSNDLSRFGVEVIAAQCRKAGLTVHILPAG